MDRQQTELDERARVKQEELEQAVKNTGSTMKAK